jgi:O-antigen/teichoic acid export membrane protein
MSATAAVPAPRAPPAGAAIARNAFHLMLGQVATTVLSVGLNAVLGRSLGAADFGLFYLLTSMVTFAYVFVDWGQGVYLIREVARHPSRSGELLGTSLAVRGAGAALVWGLTLLVVRVLGYDARTRHLSMVMMVTSLPLFLAQACAQTFRGHERMDYEAALTVVGKALTLAAIVPALFFGGRLPAVILAQGMAGLAALAVAALLLGRLRLPPLRVSPTTGRELLVGGTPFVALILAITVQAYIDAVVLSKMAPATAVGWFGAAKNIMNALITPASILGAASFPRLSRAAADPGALKREVHSALRPLLGLGALGTVGTYLFAEAAIGLVYGLERFSPAVAILHVFSPVILLLFLDVLLGNAIVAVGRPRQLATAKAAAIVLCTALDIVLVPFCQERFGNGGLGLVIAFAAGELFMVGAALLLIPRGTLERGVFVDMGRAVLAGALTALLIKLLPPMPPFLAMAACVATFLFLAMAVGLMDRGDLALLKSMLSRRGTATSGRG